MNLKALQDKNLLIAIRKLVAQERGITLSVLEHLNEIERRSLYAKAAYPSLFEYAVKELGYSESAAQRRISAMRLLRSVPEMKEKVASGELSLSTLSQAQSFFKTEDINDASAKVEVLKSLENKSARETEKELASRSQRPQHLRAEKLRTVSSNLSEIRLMVDEEFLQLIEQLKNLSGRQGLTSFKDLLQFALKECVSKLTPKAPKTKTQPTSEVAKPSPSGERSPTRYIPAEIKRVVWERDKGQCNYQDPATGKVCGSKYKLEYDHIQAFAKGGETHATNLRLRCRAHNLLWATETYGSEHMQQHVPRMRV